MNGPEYDVTIVGYGPVGQMLAILLGQRGWKVGVFEKQPAAYPLPRAVHFDHEVGRILQAAGLAREVTRISEAADTYEWRNAAGQTLLRFGRRPASLSGWPESSMFAQPELERLLDVRVRSLPSVAVHRGCDVCDLGSSEEAVELCFTAADGQRRTVRARYVVGCDGANSFVREQLGVSSTDLGFAFDWLVVDVIPNEARIWTPLNCQLCDPARPTTLVSGGPGRRRWEFMRLPGETIEELNNETTAWRLLEPWDIRPGNAILERHAVYTFRAHWADAWRKGRVLIAGDAAHLMPPFAGQGMCSGLRDVANLAWKLDLILAGHAADTLLDSYTSERLPNVRAFIDFSVALGKIICIADPQEAAERDASMSAAVQEGRFAVPPTAPPIGPGILRDGDPFAGQLFIQGPVTCGSTTGLFDDVVGRGWVLLSPLCDPATQIDADAAAFFTSIGGICAQVSAGGPVRDTQGAYADWFAAAGIEAVLQRPDFYVFGTARRADCTGALIDQLREALSGEVK